MRLTVYLPSWSSYLQTWRRGWQANPGAVQRSGRSGISAGGDDGNRQGDRSGIGPGSLEIARRAAHEMGLEGMVEFLPAEKDHLPMLDSSFDALVSEFIVYPTSSPTEIGQTEMARVLAPGGKMVLTDVIVTKPLPAAGAPGASLDWAGLSVRSHPG